MNEERYPILGKGETLVHGIERRGTGGPKVPVRDFASARARLIPQLKYLLQQIDAFDAANRLDRIFFRVSLDTAYLAKSYFPSTLVSDYHWDFVGSRPWYQLERDGKAFPQRQLARMLFFKAYPQAIEGTYLWLSEQERTVGHDRSDFTKIDSLGLQTVGDKLIGLESIDVGVVELIFHPMTEREWKEAEEKLATILSPSSDCSIISEWKRGQAGEPIFLPAMLTKAAVEELANFNPLRAARPMPRISVPRTVDKRSIVMTSWPRSDPGSTEYPRIGVFDGGVDNTSPMLEDWTSSQDITPEPLQDRFFDHGTAVCGAVLFGSCDPSGGQLTAPQHRVKCFRVFPVPQHHGLDLDIYQILDWIEDIVEDEANADILVYVLSFGPDKPIDDLEVDRFTTVLDRLAYDNPILFTVAAGNNGTEQPPFNRIQPPSDLVNGMGVGAFTLGGDGSPVPADYCPVGPGRPGSRCKPDVSAFGGCEAHPFWVVVPGPQGSVRPNSGTSFAVPLVAQVASDLLYRASDPDMITAQTARALMIHHATPYQNCEAGRYGHGVLPQSADEFMECLQNEVKVLYNGSIELTKTARLPLPFPEDLDFTGQVEFKWTIVYTCDVSAATPDDYTLGGVEVFFRPNASLFTYRKSGAKDLRVDERLNPDSVPKLADQGWKKGQHPLTDQYKTEQVQRDEGKWDTACTGVKRKRAGNVYRPMLDLHALGRGPWDRRGGPGRISYAAVVTVRVTDPAARLYQRVREQMPQLVPVRLRQRARRRIR